MNKLPGKRDRSSRQGGHANRRLTVAVLGAGAMGSALTRPIVEGGHEARLWGTWLDDDLLDAVESGEPHPRLDVRLPAGARTFRSRAIGEVLDGADIVALAVSSEGVAEVSSLAARTLGDASVPVLVFTKGLDRRADGRVRLLSELLADTFGDRIRLVFAGGPCKANEIASNQPTAAVYGGSDLEAVQYVSRAFTTSLYCVEQSQDVVGVEVCGALKNVYAIALGACDGIGVRSGRPWHNLRSAVFARAVKEMELIAEAMGGQAGTVRGLAGVGDLEVTGLSGRNKVYGERVGAGEDPTSALIAMRALGQTVEGVRTERLAADLVAQLTTSADVSRRALPLLGAVAAILSGRAALPEALSHASLPA